MILAKVRLIGEVEGHLKVGLFLPSGFEPEEVVQETVRANDTIPPDGFYVEPRRGGLGDAFRELEVSFPESAVADGAEAPATLRITGKLSGGLPFTALVPLASLRRTRPRDH